MAQFVAKWYTRASRVRIVIAKFDGKWKIPGGPYPIPELVALVGGLLTTLFALPRLGSPVMTGLFGIVATITLVVAMKLMPYSPVKFTTRVHRVARLYTEPISTTFSDFIGSDTVSTVRADVTVLDIIEPITTGRSNPEGMNDPTTGWAEMFDDQSPAAAELFA
ncbi:hypothetical protein [Mycobacteroides abscessus]|uniref:hypothetical protein n=1 Tax=Mycobacteroides abscessus TaxID=36809 RepID=UPI0009A5C578|nr:hypothetical protein [Mycobacteroides abscessus]SKT85454.1 Uncharacterised protein [Mycobacteroides abscessus subsp. massiliense]SKU05274.1 Uncharacterised protein [Mycobacteroides abscessus subsp. massiliense]